MESSYRFIRDNNHLKHYGVKGMKWRVRKNYSVTTTSSIAPRDVNTNQNLATSINSYMNNANALLNSMSKSVKVPASVIGKVKSPIDKITNQNLITRINSYMKKANNAVRSITVSTGVINKVKSILGKK